MRSMHWSAEAWGFPVRLLRRLTQNGILMGGEVFSKRNRGALVEKNVGVIGSGRVIGSGLAKLHIIPLLEQSSPPS